jgi:hypothetical protein
MGDPVGAMRRARECLAADGTVMVVEPMASERVEDNLNPVGRVFSAARSKRRRGPAKSGVGMRLIGQSWVV